MARIDKKKAIDLLFDPNSARLVSNVQTSINNLYEMEKRYIENTKRQNDRVKSSTEIFMILVTICCIGLALFIGIFISNSISKPLNQMVYVAQQIADGNLTAEIKNESRDEIGQLASSFENMINSLNQLIAGIKSASEQVALGAKQLSDASQSLAEGASEQASVIEELNASIEEVSTQTKQNAHNVEEASKFANQVKGDARHGIEQMQEMIKAMEEINTVSSNISKIIKAIDEIAFQTNILALNAAVEAARAGSYGKGFAVVAEEVRNLATRSANAAKETSELIETTIKKIETGNIIAKQTQSALDKISSGVDKMVMIMNDILYSSREQSQAIEQITEGINQVANVVQTNSANAQQTAAASEELFSQSESLKALIERFKTRN
ncbi:methyl-accepting chemotaxis protein [Caldicellulosiruptor saccharolyticus]|nr:methyl-accepting chemotaxis protein [Caldicellulosiruptor saccharolyticus]